MVQDALAWFNAAIGAIERIGLVKTLFILIALGTLIQINGILKGFNRILDTVLRHHREMIRINAKVENAKQKLAIALKGRKRKVPPAPRQPRT
jgi:hypothetical protein